MFLTQGKRLLDVLFGSPNSLVANKRRRTKGQRKFEPLEDRRLLTVTAQPLAPQPLYGDQFIEFNGATFFNGSGKLWKTDGTVAGTELVKNVGPNQLTVANGTLFFTAPDPADGGYELWKSDGTAAGTVIVKNINPYFNSLFGPKHLTNVNGTLFFDAFDVTHGRELWKSNGTESGTVMVKDIYPGTYVDENFNVVGNNGINPYLTRNLTNVNGTLFFMASNYNNSGQELWKSDGSDAGTVLVKDFSPSLSFPENLTGVNGTLFFGATNKLWKSDGTSDGTVVVKDMPAGLLRNISGTLYFFGNDGVSEGLWKSDGTTDGTVFVKDVRPGSGSANIQDVTSADGTLFFTADDGIHGIELWKSDGTEAGTVLVKDIFPGSGSSVPRSGPNDGLELAHVNGTVFFGANDGVHGRELWMSDGTAAGTLMVQEIVPGTSDPIYSGIYSPNNITNVDGQIYFTANGAIWILVMPPVELVVNTATVSDDLQTAVVDALDAATGTGAGPSQIVLAASQTQIDPVVAAVENLAPNTSGQVVTVVVHLADGNYTGQTIAVPAGVQLVIDGTSSSITFVGHSPAFTVTSGDVVLTGLTFVNTTDASTILVTGGNVTVRNSVISETTSGSRAAVEVTGGTANLGTVNDPGGNTIVVNGSGDFVRNSTAHEVPVFGDTFKTGATSISTNITVVEPQKRLFYDASSGGLAEVSTVLLVAMDVQQPSLNIEQNGTISIVLYGSSQFDVTQVQLNSLTFAGVSISTFNQTFSDANHDGYKDLKLQFQTSNALKAALTAIYSNLLLEDHASGGQLASREDALLALDGTFGAFGQQFEGSESVTMFLAGKSLSTLLSSLGI